MTFHFGHMGDSGILDSMADAAVLDPIDLLSFPHLSIGDKIRVYVNVEVEIT